MAASHLALKHTNAAHKERQLAEALSALQESPMDAGLKACRLRSAPACRDWGDLTHTRATGLKAEVRTRLSSYVVDDDLRRLKAWMDIPRRDEDKSWDQLEQEREIRRSKGSRDMSPTRLQVRGRVKLIMKRMRKWLLNFTQPPLSICCRLACRAACAPAWVPAARVCRSRGGSECSACHRRRY